jgi:hypothetical protein
MRNVGDPPGAGELAHLQSLCTRRPAQIGWTATFRYGAMEGALDRDLLHTAMRQGVSARAAQKRASPRRYARHQFLTRAFADPHYDLLANAQIIIRRLLREQGRIGRSLVELKYPRPEGWHKLATILSQEAKQLRSMDRYEQRALSRRKFAIRAFDEARQQIE